MHIHIVKKIANRSVILLRSFKSKKEVSRISNLQKDLDLEIKRFIDTLPSLDGAQITIRHHAQQLYSYLPSGLQSYIARPAARVYGVVRFKSFLTKISKGKYRFSVYMGK